jgi:hypothetical protein
MRCVACLAAVILFVLGALTERWGLVLLGIAVFVVSRMGRTGAGLSLSISADAGARDGIVGVAPREIGDTRVTPPAGVNTALSLVGGGGGDCV